MLGRVQTIMLVAVLLLSPVAAVGDGRQSRGIGDRIYGQELLTLEERDAYRQQLWERKTERDREEFRRRHQERMRERAATLGVPLLEETIQGEAGGEPAQRRAEDGLRRLAAPSTEGSALRRWAPPESGLRRWPEAREEKSWRSGRPRAGLPEAVSRTAGENTGGKVGGVSPHTAWPGTR